MSNDNDKDQEYQKNMGKRLRKIRKENALSQDDVACSWYMHKAVSEH